MRVLYFTQDHTPHDHRFLAAAAEQGAQTFALRLERRGMQREDRPLPAGVTRVRWSGGERPFRWRDLPTAVLGLRRVLREVRPDVIHAGPLPGPAFIAALAGARPLVSMSWGSDLLRDAQTDRWTAFRARYALRRSRVLIGDCHAVQQAAGKLAGFPAGQAVIFPWGVELERFQPGPEPGLRARMGWQDCFVIVSLRAWEPVYGVDVLIRAFAAAAQQAPQLRLILAGGGSLAGMVQDLIYRHGLNERVSLPGHIPQASLPELYRAADLYVSASHSDGSSVSLLEALACGLPALVSDIPGNREWIEPGGPGWLFPDGDAAALAQAMVTACEASAGLDGLRRKARALAEARADWSLNRAKIMQAYRLALGMEGDRDA